MICKDHYSAVLGMALLHHERMLAAEVIRRERAAWSRGERCMENDHPIEVARGMVTLHRLQREQARLARRAEELRRMTEGVER